MKLHLPSAKRRAAERGFSHVELFFAVIFVAIIAFVGVRILNASHAATNCAVSSQLVNSCRPWQGVSANKYPGVAGDLKSRTTDYESRTGTKADFIHDFATAGQTLTADDIYYVNRPNTYLLLNYKPSTNWASADGSNASVNANIDAMAKSIKAQGSHKIILALWHEPNNDVSGGASGCPANFAYTGGAGTPAQYRAMWQNVRNRFDALGVTNVEWAIIYMSGTKWDCMQKEMWPGNSLVDWVMWDHYYTNNETFASGTSRFYNWLVANTDATHDFTNHPWGIGEWGSWQTNQSAVYQLYADGGKALQANTYSRIKLWTVWDSVAANDSRIQYTAAGVKDQKEQDTFNADWAQNSAFSGKVSTPTPSPTGDTIAPSVSITSPASGARVNGIVIVGVSASDNVAVTRTVVSWDSTVIRDASSTGTYGWGSAWDTTKVPNGSHTLIVTAYDAAGNTKVATITINVKN